MLENNKAILYFDINFYITKNRTEDHRPVDGGIDYPVACFKII